MERRQHTPIFIGLFLAIALCTGLLAACAPQQQGGSGAAASGSSPVQETLASSAAGEVDIAKAFPSWNADSDSLAKLVDYVRDVTDESSPAYVEPADRVATFDMDGTLISEKAPVYVDYCLLFHRVFDDPGYEAPAEYVKTCEKLRANADKGIVDDALDPLQDEALLGSFAGMTPEDFIAYINDFLDSVPVEGFDGMTYGGSIYKPMAEIVDYLHANDFEVYVVTASGRDVARAIVGSRLGIEPDHVLGTDYGTKATGQGDTPGETYTFSPDDELVLDGTETLNVAKTNKVVFIEREIGKRPLLAFGNSSGDYAMLNYALANPEHPGMGLLVLCDDVEREYGDVDRAAKQADEAQEAGWTTFSMAKDWATIYGDGVTKTQLPADADKGSARSAA